MPHYQRWFLMMRKLAKGSPYMATSTYAHMIPNIEKLVDIITNSIDRKKKVLLAGCGTSGRLGFFCSRQFNRILSKFGLFGVFDYSLAGDDEAIFVSNEIVEDSPQMGSDDLTKEG